LIGFETMRRRQTLGVLALLLPVTAQAETLTGSMEVTGLEQMALSLDCDATVQFGTVSIAPGNSQGTVTLSPQDGSVTVSGTGLTVAEAGRAACVVAGESGGDATATLSASDATCDVTGCSGLDMSGPAGSLPDSVSLTLSKTSGIGDETFHIGGSFTVPANFTQHGIYSSQTVTVTITD